MKRRVAIILVLVVLVGAGFLFWLQRNTFGQQQEFRLPDRSQLFILGSTYGTNHSFVPGGMWDRFLARLPQNILPPSLQRDVETADDLTPTLRLWFVWARATNVYFPPSISVEDENGLFSPPVEFDSSDFTINQLIDHGSAAVPSFPPRAKQFTIHFLQEGHNGRFVDAAKMSFAQPTSRAPAWKPEPLPVTRREGDLEVTLQRLITNVQLGDDPTPSPPTNVWESATWAGFKIQQNGMPARDWLVKQITCSAPNGCVLEPNETYEPEIAAERSFVFNTLLWPSEPAWKLRVELSRKKNFAPDELVTFKQIVVKTNLLPGRLVGLDDLVTQRASVQGHQLNVLYVMSHPATKRFVTLYLTSDQPLTDYRFTVVQARDENGRKLTDSGFGTFTNRGYSISLSGKKLPETVDITLAVHKSRFVEFLASPEVLKNKH